MNEWEHVRLKRVSDYATHDKVVEPFARNMFNGRWMRRLLLYLSVGELLVDDDAVYQLRVAELASRLPIHL